MTKFEELISLLDDDKVLSGLNVDAEKKRKIRELVRALKDPFARPVGAA
jgi:hypothetical protein